MEAYKFIQVESGDILLQKTSNANSNFKLETQENGDILLKKINLIDILDISELKNIVLKILKLQNVLLIKYY